MAKRWKPLGYREPSKWYPLAMRLWTACCIVGFLLYTYAGLYQPDWFTGVPEVEGYWEIAQRAGYWAFSWAMCGYLMNLHWGGNTW